MRDYIAKDLKGEDGDLIEVPSRHVPKGAAETKTNVRIVGVPLDI
jgi:hypothetical protein